MVKSHLNPGSCLVEQVFWLINDIFLVNAVIAVGGITYFLSNRRGCQPWIF